MFEVYFAIKATCLLQNVYTYKYTVYNLSSNNDSFVTD